MSNVLVDQAVEQAKKYKEFLAAVERQQNAKDGYKFADGEQGVFYDLINFIKYDDYNPSECKKYLDFLNSKVSHHSGWNDLLEFRRICNKYCTKDKDAFVAFQKALGGKQQRPQSQQQQQQSQQQSRRQEPVSQPTPSPTPTSVQGEYQAPRRVVPAGHERIDYNGGDYYIGVVRNGQPSGQGTYYFADGSWMKGTFINGKLTDKNAEAYWSKNDIKDIGEYVNSHRSGRGRIEWKNGSYYEGEWNDAHGRHGNGTYYSVKDKRSDIGQFHEGYRKGNGTMKWSSGDRYEGTWDDTSGKLNGKGVYIYANGAREACKYVDGEYVKTGIDISISGLGMKLWDFIPWTPWLIFAFYLIMEFFTGSFWSIVGVAVFGGIAALICQGILIWAKEFIEGLPRWVKIGALIVVGLWLLWIVVGGIISGVGSLFDGFSKPKTELVSEKITATVTANSLNMRSAPNSNAKVVKGLKKGEEIIVTGESANGWLPVEHKGSEGYVSKDYIRINGEQELKTETTEQQAPVKTAQIKEEQKPKTTPAAQPETVTEEKTTETEDAQANVEPVVDEIPAEKIENLQKVFNPRPQVMRNGVTKQLYIDRVIIENGKFYVFFTGAAKGDGGDGVYQPFWQDLNMITLSDLVNPSRTWKPIDKGEDENFTRVHGGFYLVFENVSGTRFRLRGADSYVFMRIILE